MTLPLALSVPHAGLTVPAEAAPWCMLTPREIAEDGDAGSGEIYDLRSEVAAFETTRIARAVVDLNRAEDDRSGDGVVKTHTCWSAPVYREPLPESVVQQILAAHYRPYHRRLSSFASPGGVRLAIDCHTMAATGPPAGPDPGVARPWICLSNREGTCPEAWIRTLGELFETLLGGPVTLNDPFRGGYTIRHHSAQMPWLQLEVSREPFSPDADKRAVVLEALTKWVERFR